MTKKEIFMNRRATTILLASTLGIGSSSDPAFAQKQKKPAMEKEGGSEPQQYDIRVPVNVVVVHVTVTDKQKNRDLTAEEIKIYEDGKHQPQHTFALECYDTPKRTGIADRPATITSPAFRQ